MFVLATMAAASGSGPIKIRNMSQGGALLEGGALPAVGEHLSLRRGELAVSGHVVWRQQGKAGLSFDCHVEVMDWLPAGSGQQRVDRTFQELKASSAPARPVGSPRAGPSPIGKSDLLTVADALDVLADVLAEDSRLVALHASKLQVLDAASQILRRCAEPPVSPPSNAGASIAVSAARSF